MKYQGKELCLSVHDTTGQEEMVQIKFKQIPNELESSAGFKLCKYRLCHYPLCFEQLGVILQCSSKMVNLIANLF